MPLVFSLPTLMFPATMRRLPSTKALTLIELMLAIAIAIIIAATAVPSMRGLSGAKRLREKFEQFDELARKAQFNAVSQQRSWTIFWQNGMLSLQPDSPTPEERQANGEGVRVDFPIGENESYVIQRPASLRAPKDTPAEWTFWRSGTCEPVQITYTGPDGEWTAEYNPLTCRGDTIEEIVR